MFAHAYRSPKNALEILRNNLYRFLAFVVLIQTFNSRLEDGADISRANRRNLVESLHSALRKLSNSHSGADSASCSSERHLFKVLFLYCDAFQIQLPRQTLNQAIHEM